MRKRKRRKKMVEKEGPVTTTDNRPGKYRAMCLWKKGKAEICNYHTVPPITSARSIDIDPIILLTTGVDIRTLSNWNGPT